MLAAQRNGKKKITAAYQTGLSLSLKFKTNKVMLFSASKTGKLSESRLSAYWLVTGEVSKFLSWGGGEVYDTIQVEIAVTETFW